MSAYTLAMRQEGEGAPLLFLHALAASSRYWQGRLGDLPTRFHCLMPDLLGFADSPQPSRLAYTVDDHLAALVHTLETTGNGSQPLCLIGHSLGAILAVEFAARFRERIQGLIVIGLPLFACEAEARTYLNAHVGWIARSTLGTGRRAHLGYLLGTPFHPLVHFLALHLVQSFPREIVEDSFKNTWESYTRTLEHCIFDHDLTPALAALSDLPILALHGTHDSSAPLEKVTALAARMPNVRLETLPGDHHILLEQNGACIAAVSRYIDAVTMRERRGVSPSQGRK